MFTENRVDGGFFGQSSIELEHLDKGYHSYSHRDSLTLYNVSIHGNDFVFCIEDQFSAYFFQLSSVYWGFCYLCYFTCHFCKQ